MKMTKRIAVAITLALVTPGLVSAQDEEKKPGRNKKAQAEKKAQVEKEAQTDRPARPAKAGGVAAMLKRLPLVVALDKDSNGELSATEIEGAVAALQSLDKNGDGKLTIEELRPLGGNAGQPGPQAGGPPAGNGEMMARMFETRDANGDGMLSGDEIPEQMMARIERLDTNADGAIDKEEMKKAAGRMARQLGGNKIDRADDAKNGSGVKPKRPATE